MKNPFKDNNGTPIRLEKVLLVIKQMELASSGAALLTPNGGRFRASARAMNAGFLTVVKSTALKISELSKDGEFLVIIMASLLVIRLMVLALSGVPLLTQNGDGSLARLKAMNAGFLTVVKSTALKISSLFLNTMISRKVLLVTKQMELVSSGAALLTLNGGRFPASARAMNAGFLTVVKNTLLEISELSKDGDSHSNKKVHLLVSRLMVLVLSGVPLLTLNLAEFPVKLKMVNAGFHTVVKSAKLMISIMSSSNERILTICE
jgi:hypothetical protein